MVKVGQKIKSKVTGIKPYGVFVILPDGTQGLVHISEITAAYIKDINDYYQIGDPIEVLVIDVDEYSKRVSLSVKALKNDEVGGKNTHKHFWTSRNYHTGFAAIAQMQSTWIENGIKKFKNA